MTKFSLHELEKIIAERVAGGDSSSYSAKLVAQGIERAAQKLGEEATETVIAALSGKADDLSEETADLLYHLLVVLHINGVKLDDVLSVLSARHEKG